MADIFLKIFNISITASYLVLAVLLLRLILKKAPKWSICLLWGLVALRLVMPFSFESELSLIPSAKTVVVSDTADAPFEINTGVSTVDTEINNIITENKDSINEVNQSINDTFIAVEDNFNPPSDNKTETHLQDSDTVEKTKISIFTVLGFVWLLGVLAMLIYSAISYLIIHRKVKVSLPYRDNIYYCDNIDTSFILGMFKPKIYIQSGMSQENTDYVIKHEKAHLKRCDHLLKPFAFLLLSVYWFNPLIWVAYILLCRDIESACDERVIEDENIDDIVGYSSALLECGTNHKKLLACPVAFGEVSVKSRIKSVLKYKRPADWLAALAVVLAVAVGVGFLTNPKAKASAFSDETVISSIEQIAENTVSDAQSDSASVSEDEKTEEAISHQDENTSSDSVISTSSEDSSSKDDTPIKFPNQNSGSSSENSIVSSETIQNQFSPQENLSDIIIDTEKIKLYGNDIDYKININNSVEDWFVENDYLYMILGSAAKYIVYDTNTGTVVCEKQMVGNGAEMHNRGDELWISYPDLKCIKIHDKQTFKVKETMVFDYEIASFDFYNNYLFFTEYDQHVRAFRYDFNTGENIEIRKSLNRSFYYADVLVNAEQGYVYISDSRCSGCGVYCYDIESLILKSYYLKNNYGYDNKARRSFLSGGYIYWGEFRLDALDVSIVDTQYVSQYPAGMFQVGENFIATDQGIYTKNTCEILVDLTNYFNVDVLAVTKSGNVIIVANDYLYIATND